MTEFSDYVAHGWKLCSIAPGQKGPTGEAATGWNLPNAPYAQRPGWGAGLCHAYSGTCAIDIDEYEVAKAWLAERDVDLDALLADPFSVRIHSGRAGRAKLLYALPAPLASVKTAPFEGISPKTGKPVTYTALDFRCATKDGLTMQDVLPPSIHPITQRPYEWQYGDELMADWRALPEIPRPLLDTWLGELRERAGPADACAPVPLGAHAESIRALLANIDPDVVYTDWIKYGCAVHHETRGSAEGFRLWDEWSAKGSKYEGTANLEPHWRSFSATASNPVTLASLLAAQPKVASPDEFDSVPRGTEGEDLRPDAVMRRLLETRLVHVNGQDRYYDLETDKWMSDRGIKHAFCPYMPERIQAGKNGKPDKVIRPDPVKFLMESDSKEVVDGVSVHPGEGRFFVSDGVRYANPYVPAQVEPLRPKSYEREAFDFLWSRIKDPDIANWLMKFFAHAVAKPGIKITAAPLLFSEAQGTGKNTIMRVVPELLFGAKWVNSMTTDVLSSNFTDTLPKTWWLYMEELRSGESKSQRSRLTNKMKAWITDPYIEVHPKTLSPYTIPNRLQLTATSNYPDAVQVDENDRRWAIAEMKGILSDRESVDLYSFLKSDRAAGVLRYIFQQVSLIGFSPTARAPKSKAKTVMIRAGVGTWESLLVEYMVAGRAPFDRDMFTQEMVRENVMFRGQSPTAIGLGRILAKAPFNCEALKGQGATRYLCWRNYNEWLRFTVEQRATYVASGVRPKTGTWTDQIPTPIHEMSADGDLDLSADQPVQSAVPETVADLF